MCMCLVVIIYIVLGFVLSSINYLVFLKLKNFDPFLMLDEFKGKAPGGFPDHPHRGFETVGLYLSPNPSIKMLS